ncbi:MAG: sugar phosphate isomerase/epimerase family protein [Candidatus Methylomirabilota bacterium]
MKLALTATPSDAQFAPILWRGSIAEAFALAREFGYDGVEVHPRYAADIDAAAVIALQQKYRLGIPTLGTGMIAGEDGLTFSDPDPEVRRRAISRVGEHIRLAARVGSAVTIGLVRGRLGRREQRSVRRAAMVECVGECCRLAAEQNVTVFLEPLNRYEADDLLTLDQGADVIRELGAPNLKLLADTFHMNIEERDLAASLRRHAALLGHVHLVDSNREVPGHGHTDIKSILRALLDVHYQGYLCFEVLPVPESRQAAKDGIETVREILKSLDGGNRPAG